MSRRETRYRAEVAEWLTKTLADSGPRDLPDLLAAGEEAGYDSGAVGRALLDMSVTVDLSVEVKDLIGWWEKTP